MLREMSVLEQFTRIFPLEKKPIDQETKVAEGEDATVGNSNESKSEGESSDDDDDDDDENGAKGDPSRPKYKAASYDDIIFSVSL